MAQKPNIRRVRLALALSSVPEQFKPSKPSENVEKLELRLQRLERWEMQKLESFEQITDEIDRLVELEKKIQQRELELELRGIDVDELILNHTNASKAAANIRAPSSIKKTPLKFIKPAQTKSTSLQKMKIPKLKSQLNDQGSNVITIGPNGTTIPKEALHNINWSLSGAALTRKILVEVFGRDTLATHTLTGKPSPAFVDCVKPAKGKLDANKVADIVHLAANNFEMTVKEARAAITTKCADEDKMARQRMSKIKKKTN